MLERDDFELLQRQQDGELLPGESKRVEALLSTNADARSAAAALKALRETALSEQGEPPADAVARIMAMVQSAPSPRRSWLAEARNTIARGTGFMIGTSYSVTGHGSRVEESMSSRSKIVWGISTAAVLILVALYLGGIVPPAPDGADATIGAAKRYQAPQLTAKDVAVKESEAQAFMQSETFDRLLKDPNARKMLGNSQF